MRLYDFRCPDGHVFEELVKSDVHEVRCKCGQDAVRIISPINFHLDGSDTAWPTAHDRWVKEHERAGTRK